jgi:RHS repeat-associated protein
MVYDGDGNRVSETVGSTTTNYLVDTLNPTGYSQVMDEVVSGAVTRTYTYGLQRISENQLVSSTWVPSFYGYDGHGNVRFLANSSGAVTDSYTYDAFGMPIASTGTTANNFRYSGEWLDPNLSFYNLRARYYNALTGRFETMDPYQGDISVPATLHKYAYTGNNPVNWVNPIGWDEVGEQAGLAQVRITFGHGARHLIGTAVNQTEVESAIEQMIREWLAANPGLTQQFLQQEVHAYLEVKGVGIVARVYFLTAAWINVGSYIPLF